MRFMAMASVVCASRLIEPKLIAPVEKRLTISAAGSTSSSGIGSSAALEAHQAADGQQPLALLVDRCRRRSRYSSGSVAAHGVLQLGDALRRPGVVLAAQAPGVGAADVQHVAIDRRVAIGVAVTAHALLGDLGQAGALDRGVGAGEVLLDEGGREPDRVEDLRAAVGLVGGDAHLGHHLQHALAERLDVVLLHLVGLELASRSATRSCSSVSKAR